MTLEELRAKCAVRQHLYLTVRRKPGNPVWCPNCGSLAAFQWRE